MVSLVIYDKNKEEGKELEAWARDVQAYLSDEALDVVCVGESQGIRDYLSGKNLMDMAFLDVTPQDGVPTAMQIRRNNEEADLLLLADATISPMSYLNPGIRAASLLIRPYSKDQEKQVVGDFFRAWFRDRDQGEGEGKMVLETREGKTAIPFSKIYYIEVREKRLYVRLKNTEYLKYGTLSQAMEGLSDRFLRCHRSYAVNKEMIQSVRLSEGLILLHDNMEVPLSRSYKKEVKEYLNALG